MGRSAASKLRRKSQREASELRDQSDATLAMEEEELAREEEDEIVFKRRRTVPDTPRASRDGTPVPDEREEGHRQVEKVMQLVQTVREQTIRTLGLLATIYASSAISRGSHSPTYHEW